MKNKIFKRSISIFMVFAMLLSMTSFVYADTAATAAVSEVYVSPRGVTVQLNAAAEEITVEIDGTEVTTTPNADKTQYKAKAEAAIAFDTPYLIVVKQYGSELWKKNVTLEKLLEDDFEDDTTGWGTWNAYEDDETGITAPTGALVVGPLKSSKNNGLSEAYYGANQAFNYNSKTSADWSDYRIDLKIKNPIEDNTENVHNNKFRLYVETYKASAAAGNTMRFGLLDFDGRSTDYTDDTKNGNWFMTMNKNSAYLDWSNGGKTDFPVSNPVQGGDLIWNMSHNGPGGAGYATSQYEQKFESENAYIERVKTNPRTSTEDYVSFITTSTRQTYLIADEVKKTTNFALAAAHGGFELNYLGHMAQGQGVWIDDIAVYKQIESDFVQATVSDVYVSPRGVTVQLNAAANGITVEIDGTAVKTTPNADKTQYKAEAAIAFDTPYLIVVKQYGSELWKKNVTLEKLLEDDFTGNSKGWKKRANDGTVTDATITDGSLVLEKSKDTPIIYYMGDSSGSLTAEQADWTQYRVDIKLKESTVTAKDRWNFVLSTYNTKANENKGVDFLLYDYSGGNSTVQNWVYGVLKGGLVTTRTRAESNGASKLWSGGSYAASYEDTDRAIKDQSGIYDSDDSIYIVNKANDYLSFVAGTESKASTILNGDDVVLKAIVPVNGSLSGGITLRNVATTDAATEEKPNRARQNMYIDELVAYKQVESDFVQATVSDVYVSPRGVTVQLNAAAKGITVEIDGTAVAAAANADKTQYKAKAEAAIAFDTPYLIVVKQYGSELWKKNVTLEKLLEDEFTDNLKGWKKRANDGTVTDATITDGSLVLEKSKDTPIIYYMGDSSGNLTAEQTGWKQYRVDIKLKESTVTTKDRWNFVLGTYNTKANENKGVDFLLYDYSGGNSTVQNWVYGVLKGGLVTTRTRAQDNGAAKLWSGGPYAASYEDADRAIKDQSGIYDSDDSIYIVNNANDYLSFVAGTGSKASTILNGDDVVLKATVPVNGSLSGGITLRNVATTVENTEEKPNQARQNMYIDELVAYKQVESDFVPDAETIGKVYMSDRAVTIDYPGIAGETVVKLDGAELTYKSTAADRMSMVFEADVEFDKWYNLTVEYMGKEVYNKTVQLQTLLFDDFEVDASGWSQYDKSADEGLYKGIAGYKEGALTMSNMDQSYTETVRAENVTDFGDTDKWSDYRVDVKLKNPVSDKTDNTDKFGFYIETYLPENDDDERKLTLKSASEDGMTYVFETGGLEYDKWYTLKVCGNGETVYNKAIRLSASAFQEEEITNLYRVDSVQVNDTNGDGNLTVSVELPQNQIDHGKTIEWFASDINGDGTYTKISEGSAPLNIAGYPTHLIKAVVTPLDNNGASGLSGSCVYINPKLPPVVKDVSVSGEAIGGKTLRAVYTYFDYNDPTGAENRDRVDVKWYTSSDQISWTEVAAGDTLTLGEEHLERYMKVTLQPYSREAEATGAEKEVPVGFVELPGVQKLYVSPKTVTVAGAKNAAVSIDGTTLPLIVSTDKENVYSTGGLEYDRWYTIIITSGGQTLYKKAVRLKKLLADDFESGSENWAGDRDENDGTLRIPKGSAYTPTKVFYGNAGSGTFGAGQENWQDYRIDLELANDKYDTFALLVDAYRSKSDDNNAGFGFALRGYRSLNMGWFDSIYKGGSRDTVISSDILYWYDSKGGRDDELGYLNKFDGIESPFDKGTIVSFIASRNEQTIIIDGKVRKTTYLQSSSDKGGFVLSNLTAANSGDDVMIESLGVYNVEEKALSDLCSVENVSLTYNAETNQLSVTYDIPGSTRLEGDDAVIEWYARPVDGDTFTKIENQTNWRLSLRNHSNHIIRVVVVPKENNGTDYGITGRAEYIPELPTTAENIKITGSLAYGEKLTGNYRLTDPNGTIDREAVVGWETYDKNTGTYTDLNISSKDITITDNLAGKHLVFRVALKAAGDLQPGEPKRSEPVYIYHAPVLNNFKIKEITAGTYGADYSFYSADNLSEGDTQFKWYVNNVYTSNARTISVSGNCTLRLEITPVAKKLDDPSISVSGTTMTATVTASASVVAGGIPGGSLGGGGGIGGGGGSLPAGTLPGMVQGSVNQAMNEAANDGKFIDMASHWARNNARFAVEEGIMSLSDKQNFIPELFVSRYEFLVYVLKAAGIAEEAYSGAFGDVAADDWYSGYVAAALNKGIISEDELFNPFKPITREEVCKILALALGWELQEDAEITSFADSGKISGWAVPYVAAAVKNGCIQGTADGYFNPQDYLTRAQVSAIIERIMKRK